MRTDAATATLTDFEAAWDDFFAAIRRARGRAAAREREGELTLSQHHLLTALHHEPRLPVGEVAMAAGVAPHEQPNADRAQRNAHDRTQLLCSKVVSVSNESPTWRCWIGRNATSSPDGVITGRPGL